MSTIAFGKASTDNDRYSDIDNDAE
jgi:hypothetical protein